MGLQARSVEPEAESEKDDPRWADLPLHDARVIFYSQVEGYGFLAVDGYPHDLFLHFKQVKKSQIPPGDLKKGMKVRCAIGSDHTDAKRPIAVRLTKV